MGQAKNWTTDEIDYLEESWGNKSLPAIASHLNRSVGGVRLKATRLNLGRVLESGEYVTFNQLVKAVTGGSNSHTYHLTSWVKNRNFPIHTKRVKDNTFRIVYINEFWKWAEKNRSFIDFSKMEPLILGKEPEWVPEQRKRDFEAFSLQRKDVWTPQEDSRLKLLLKQQRYGYAELSQMLNRSAGAIQRRCTDLGIKDRPVRADNHGDQATWTEEMYEIVAEGIRKGESYASIGLKIGKSEKAIRGKVYTVYLTENADKVREMVGSNGWGHGAPEPNIKQALSLSARRSECKKLLSTLTGLLRYRMNSLGYEPYWQRHMCMKWDDFKGCSAGCSSCDECTEFERIKPQGCARCGKTFYERVRNRFCADCRLARKKKAQKKWCIVNSMKNRRCV